MNSSEVCRECNAPTQRNSKFCAKCGRPIEAAAGRRQLTLLFCDLVGSTGLSERLDPEDLRDLLTSYRRVCQDAIGRYEGHISQFLGDGVMAYFGYPTAHEDDAVRASSAALRIVEGVKLANQGIGKRLHVEIQVRVGLHTGLAVVGDIGPGGAHDRLAVGEAVNVASRIQSVAEAGTVVVSASTARLVEGHFELHPLGVRTLLGFTRQVELFRVVRSTGARTSFQAAARGKLTPHVGREKELAEIEAVWKRVLEGGDQVVVVRGEAGIGKSRFVDRFRQSALQEGTRVLECFCSPLTQSTAMASIVEMLNARVVERAGSTSSAARLEALQTMVSDHSRFGPEALPLLAGLLSIPGADEALLQDMAPLRRRARTLEIMREWMASSAERAPLALLVEDIHWADPSTLEFLNLIAAEGPGGRTLLCMTARPEFLASWSSARVQTIDLRRLNASEVQVMVTHVAGGHALPPLVASRIAERSEGVPLFVEEVTKAALESGVLRLDADRYELARTSDDEFLPSSVNGSIIARFDGLGTSRRVAELAAVIGREFAYPLIKAVSNLDDDELQQHLERISRAEIAFVHGEPPDSVYTFKHALIQDAIYGHVLKSERALIHGEIFAALEQKFPEVVAERPEMAAYHAENAGKRAPAVSLLRDAGTRALGRVAVVEAVKHLAHGIALVDALEEPGRTKMEIELQAAIGPAYMATMGWAAPEVEQSCSRLRDLAISTGDGPRIFQAMWGLWTVDLLRARLEPALAVARQVLDMAQGAGTPLLRVLGHHALGYTHFFRAEYTEALEHAREGLALFDLEQEKQIASVFQFSSSCALWSYRAETQQILGLTRESDESIEEWRKLLDALRHMPSRAFSLVQQSHFFYARGDYEEVDRLAREASSLASAEGFALWVPITEIFLSWVSAKRGEDAAAALARLRSAKAQAGETLTYIREIDFTGMLAETLLLANRPEEVSPAIEEALRITEPGMLRHHEAELFRLQGEAAQAMGDPSRAAAFYRTGIERARRAGAKSLDLRLSAALEPLERDAH